MDGANFREAMCWIDLDLEDSADMILMKSAMPDLDIVRAAREGVPIEAYQVSGEYLSGGCIWAGLAQPERTILESLRKEHRDGLCRDIDCTVK